MTKNMKLYLEKNIIDDYYIKICIMSYVDMSNLYNN